MPADFNTPKRLTPLERKPIWPWTRAERHTACALYWTPVTYKPAPKSERDWLVAFSGKLAHRLAERKKLRSELFIQLKAIYPDLMDSFLKTASEFSPIIGLSRRPNSPLPKLPKNLQDLEPLQSGARKFDMSDFMADYCYWFTDKQYETQVQTFFGHGALTSVFLKPDPKTAAPKLKLPGFVKRNADFQKLFARMDPDRLMQRTYSLQDAFLANSKQLFGAGLENDPQYPGLLYVIPLLATRDFLTTPQVESAKWFELFEVYVNESVEEGGMVLAAKDDLDEDLAAISEELRSEGLLLAHA
jgi:hypothetical protein